MLMSAAARTIRRTSRDLRTFLRQVRGTFPPPIGRPGLLESLRRYPDWKRALQRGSPLDDQRPWITFAAIEFLRGVVRPGARAFEWGSGGSTLFLLGLGARTTSIEHDPEWFARVSQRVSELGHSADLRLIEPQPRAGHECADAASPLGYASSDPRYSAASFAAYARAIDALDDGSADLVLIDGRARPACIRHALPKLRRGGWLMLDNADRAHYQPALDLLRSGFQRRDFAGPIPYVEHFVCTSAWRKE